MKHTLIKSLLLTIAAVSVVSCGGGEKSNVPSSTTPIQVDSGSGDGTSSTTPVHEDVTFDVIFSLNYDGAETYQTVTITNSGTVEKPNDPSRSGYIFVDWYTEAACTNVFDFDTTLSEATTLYAGWEAVDISDVNIMNFSYNYDGAPNDGIYYSAYVKKNMRPTQPTDPTRDGYYFCGWYSDPETTKEFSFRTLLTAETTAYAKWKKIYVFEAEHTDFTGVSGYGYSGNYDETDMIFRDTKNADASNGYYVAGYYYNGAEIDFNVNAAAACNDVILIVRLSAEFFDITLTSQNYTIAVNDTIISGYNIVLDNTYDVSSSNLKAFDDYVVATGVSLNAGDNVVKLITNNSNSHTATVKADAPLIDCIKLCSDTEITWSEGFPIYNKD